MKQYIDLLERILNEGIEKQSSRPHLPNTIGISKADISMNMSDGFPLLTTKKMHWKGIVHELLWFLRGETNIKYLVDNGVNIWNDDAYRWYLKFCETLIEPDYDYLMDDPNQHCTRVFTKEEFIENVKSRNLGHEDYGYLLGDLGKVYGYQWRNQNGVDQIKEVIEGLKSDPYSRYHIIDGWNKADFPEMGLPPCHLLYQFIVRPLSEKERLEFYHGEMFDTETGYTEFLDGCGIPKFYLDLNMYQRSADTALGVPYNLASMSLLLMLFAKTTNMIAGTANWIGGDTHLYIPHIPKATEQLGNVITARKRCELAKGLGFVLPTGIKSSDEWDIICDERGIPKETRIPFKLPTMNINKELNCLDDILNLRIDDFELNNYQHHPSIKYELFVGLKKK